MGWGGRGGGRKGVVLVVSLSLTHTLPPHSRTFAQQQQQQQSIISNNDVRIPSTYFLGCGSRPNVTRICREHLIGSILFPLVGYHTTYT